MALDNPNFPSQLDIKPSIVNFSGPSHLPDDRFGAAAQTQAIKTYGIAGRVWEASYTMLAYLDRASSSPNTQYALSFDPPPFTEACRDSASPNSHDAYTILELGSGTGLVAARIATHLQAGRDLMIATDLPEVCPLLQENLRDSAAVEVHPLSWGSLHDALSTASALALGSRRRLTHIVCSDLVYFPALLAPLLRTLVHLTSAPVVAPAHGPPTVVISYKIRSLAKEAAFWAAFGLWFAFTPVLARRQSPATTRTMDSSDERDWERFIPAPGQDEAFVFIASRRPESRTWVIPDGDEDLLGGVGAWGSQDHKGDDAFETMLLMSLDPMDN